ncbi:TnsA endonuclease N-terminal domain-containing protein [Paraglaciecola sp.]|uniref:TnsA endonuclease N-terminal domain-containing protein n=1 Tax=Paraglaciecola sp. TaxID=1920173 RepID=UPI00273CFDC9|nr:TnsA endonuclease N-terminal domain-containing protein [Paraglaciecola sp.]MDP5032500.1 TnsA endonuclease N-terminal domain-containing protein [Paraglaciecola sp.]
MGKKQYWNSEAKNERWIKEGRGQGSGPDYKPWLTIRDVPSQGRSHRIFGHLTQRTHHLLSDLELATFFFLQWRPITTDIREQFPLDRELTREICNQLGVEHPNVQGVDQYMSSDFVVDSEDRSKPRFAIQVKSRSAFQDSRTVEKLQIERMYWAEKEVPFFLVNENQIPRPVFENIGVLYNHIEDDASQDELLTYFSLFLKQIPQDKSLRVIDLCIRLDTAYDFDPGEALFQFKRLLAQRFFHFDITKPFTELRCSDLVAEGQHVLQEVWRVSS